MNFYESHFHVWFVCRLYGVFYLKNNKNDLKITNQALIPALLFIPAILIGIFTVTVEPNNLESYGDPSSVMYIISMFGVFSQLCNCIIILVSSLNQRKRVFKFYKNLFDFDEKLRINLNIKFDYEYLRKRNFKRLSIIGGLYMIVSFILIYIYTLNWSYLLISIIFSYANGIELISSFEYFYCTKLIAYRIKCLNNLVIGELQRSTMSPLQLELIIKSQFNLDQLILEMNRIHGLRKLISITNDFIMSVSQLYGLFNSFNDSFTNYAEVKYLFELLITPFLLYKLVATSIACQETISAKYKFGNLLKQLRADGNISVLVIILVLIVKTLQIFYL